MKPMSSLQNENALVEGALSLAVFIFEAGISRIPEGSFSGPAS